MSIYQHSYRSLIAGPIFVSHEIGIDKHACRFDVLCGTIFITWWTKIKYDGSVGCSFGKNAILGRGRYMDWLRQELGCKSTEMRRRPVFFVTPDVVDHPVTRRNIAMNNTGFLAQKFKSYEKIRYLHCQ